jgi:site-specific DNA recombinase
LELNPEESKVVKMIFQLYQGGYSIGMIVRHLNGLGILTKHGRTWSKQTIATILKNPLYCGIKHWEEILHENSHMKIIDVKTFNEIQKIRVDRIRNSKQNKHAFKLVKD